VGTSVQGIPSSFMAVNDSLICLAVARRLCAMSHLLER
jgi:hypothetical protein